MLSPAAAVSLVFQSVNLIQIARENFNTSQPLPAGVDKVRDIDNVERTK